MDEADSMRDEWKAHAEIWDQNDDARFFSEQAFSSLIEHVDLHDEAWRARRVFDFGCGTGLLTQQLAPWVAEVVALDASPAMLEVLRAKAIPNVRVVGADIDDEAVHTAGWFADFDLIVASSVCSFLPDYPATLRRLAQALAPGGTFVQWDWLLGDDADEGDDGLTLTTVTQALVGAEWVASKVESAFSIGDDAPVLIGVATRRRALRR